MVTITNVEPLFLRYRFPPSIHYEYTGGVVENQDVALVVRPGCRARISSKCLRTCACSGASTDFDE